MPSTMYVGIAVHVWSRRKRLPSSIYLSLSCLDLGQPRALDRGPHREQGFPDLEMAEYGLKRIDCREEEGWLVSAVLTVLILNLFWHAFGSGHALAGNAGFGGACRRNTHVAVQLEDWHGVG